MPRVAGRRRSVWPWLVSAIVIIVIIVVVVILEVR
jgi:hypothetical protein